MEHRQPSGQSWSHHWLQTPALERQSPVAQSESVSHGQFSPVKFPWSQGSGVTRWGISVSGLVVVVSKSALDSGVESVSSSWKEESAAVPHPVLDKTGSTLPHEMKNETEKRLQSKARLRRAILKLFCLFIRASTTSTGAWCVHHTRIISTKRANLRLGAALAELSSPWNRVFTEGAHKYPMGYLWWAMA